MGSGRPVARARVPSRSCITAGSTPRKPIDIGLVQVPPSSLDQLLYNWLLLPRRMTANRRPSASRIMRGSPKPSVANSRSAAKAAVARSSDVIEETHSHCLPALSARATITRVYRSPTNLPYRVASQPPSRPATRLPQKDMSAASLILAPPSDSKLGSLLSSRVTRCAACGSEMVTSRRKSAVVPVSLRRRDAACSRL